MIGKTITNINHNLISINNYKISLVSTKKKISWMILVVK